MRASTRGLLQCLSAQLCHARQDTHTHVGPYLLDLRCFVIGHYALGRNLMDRFIRWAGVAFFYCRCYVCYFYALMLLYLVAISSMKPKHDLKWCIWNVKTISFVFCCVFGGLSIKPDASWRQLPPSPWPLPCCPLKSYSTNLCFPSYSMPELWINRLAEQSTMPAVFLKLAIQTEYFSYSQT